MGLFGKIKEMITRSKTKKLNEGENYQQNQYQNTNSDNNIQLPYTVGLPRNMNFMITSMQVYNTVTYGNGEITNLMTANVVYYKDGDCINFDPKEKIVFEMPQGTQINLNLLQRIALGYVDESRMPNTNKDCMYLGKFTQDPYDFGFGTKNENVQRYVNEKIAPQVAKEKKEIIDRINEENRRSKEEDIKESNGFSTKMYEEHTQYMQKQMNMKRKRINNAYLKQVGEEYLTEDGKGYCDYNGININNGDFLRVRKLNKVGKDENGTYIYTGYIQTVPNEDEEEILNKNSTPYGMPVCFATHKKIEEIIESNNPNDLKKLLYLLSLPEQRINDNGYLNYIGKIDEYNTTIDGNLGHTTDTIQSIVAKLQKEFYNKKIQEQQAKIEDNYYRS